MGLIETLRKAVKRADARQHEICKATGIDKTAMSRFVSGERGLGMEAIDALCKFLGLELKQTKRKAR